MTKLMFDFHNLANALKFYYFRTYFNSVLSILPALKGYFVLTDYTAVGFSKD
jgi:hypothetical protein